MSASDESEARRREMKEALLEALHENGAASKTIVKQAIKEWLDEKYAQVGVWTLRATVALCIAVFGYVVLVQRGWKPPH